MKLDTNQIPIDISIRLDFDRGDANPNAFGLPRPSAVVAEGGGFVGDTRRGGSCNCETVTLNPHGNGTHTECVGHLSTNRIHIADVLTDVIVPALLTSVELEVDARGAFIGYDSLARSLEGIGGPGDVRALILRTLPNDPAKMSATWSGANPPWLDAEGARLIRSLGVDHLLVDIPSLDREDDPLLTSHRIFWDLPAEGAVEADPSDGRTITEMIWVPDEVADGPYNVTIQIPPFALDAAPSRVLLLPAEYAVR